MNRFLNSTADKESIPAVVSSKGWRLSWCWLVPDPSPKQLIICESVWKTTIPLYIYIYTSHCSFAHHRELPGYLTFFNHKMRFFHVSWIHQWRFLIHGTSTSHFLAKRVFSDWDHAEKTLKVRCAPEKLTWNTTNWCFVDVFPFPRFHIIFPGVFWIRSFLEGYFDPGDASKFPRRFVATSASMRPAFLNKENIAYEIHWNVMKSNLINYAYVEDDCPTWPSIIVNELQIQILSRYIFGSWKSNLSSSCSLNMS